MKTKLFIFLSLFLFSFTAQVKLQQDWNYYIDNLIAVSEDNADKVAIFDLENGSSWISYNHPGALRLSPHESNKIAQALRNEDFSSFRDNGIIVDGVKYFFLGEDGNVVWGKKKNEGAITIQKSKTAVVVAHTKEGSQQGSTNKAVQQVADYLVSIGK